MPTNRLYLYGFSRPRAPIGLGLSGIDGRSEVVELVVGPGVSAILSVIGIDALKPLLTPEVPFEPSWILPRAYQHDQILDAVMARSPVLPVRFGTIFSSKEALIEKTGGRHQDISNFLDRVVGLQEWSFKAFLEPGSATDWMLEHDPELSARARHMSTSPGARHLQQKSLREAARKRMQIWGRGQAESITESLKELFEGQLLRLALGLPSARERVMNLAILLPDCEETEIQKRVEPLATPLRQCGMSLEVSGPWPPYSFCPNFE